MGVLGIAAARNDLKAGQLVVVEVDDATGRMLVRPATLDDVNAKAEDDEEVKGRTWFEVRADGEGNERMVRCWEAKD